MVVGRGNGNGGTSQCEVFRSPKERVQLQQKTKENSKIKRLTCEVVTTTAKVALGDGGRQARLLTEGGETTSSVTTTTKTTTTTTTSIATSTPKKKKSQQNVGGLEFHAGRLDNVDRSTTKVGTQKGRVVIIAGPTAVGKSRVAIALAKQLGGEIISADSIQVPLILLCEHCVTIPTLMPASQPASQSVLPPAPLLKGFTISHFFRKLPSSVHSRCASCILDPNFRAHCISMTMRMSWSKQAWRACAAASLICVLLMRFKNVTATELAE